MPVLAVIPIILLLVAVALAVAYLMVRATVQRIESEVPPVGTFMEVSDARLHYLDVPASRPDAPTVLLLHGASGNLRDMEMGLSEVLRGDYRMILVDRPGHGWSSRGANGIHDTPAGQARTIADLLDHLGIDRAVVLGHSFGAAIATAIAVERPDKVSGLVLAAPATHPWPGGKTSWYNHLAVTPVIGRIFTETLAPLGGLSRLEQATACVFAPNPVTDNYLGQTGVQLVLTPDRFMNNARDVTSLYGFVLTYAERYREIAAPTIVVTGDSDTVVFEEIHSDGLERDIHGARKVVIRNLGHKPDHIVPEVIRAAIDSVIGRDVDLDRIAGEAEARIAGQQFGPVERCPQPKLPEDA